MPNTEAERPETTVPCFAAWEFERKTAQADVARPCEGRYLVVSGRDG
jgi:hypothetical protein